MNKIDRLKEYLKKIGRVAYTASVLRWEMNTVAPKSSFDYLIDVSTGYTMDNFKMVTSDEYIELVEGVIDSREFETLSEEEKRFLISLKKDFYKLKNVPEDFYKEYTELSNNSVNAWVEAKEKNDYQIFKPYLVKIIDATKKYYSYQNPGCDNLYDCMLDTYEEGITSEQIDKLFLDLKKEIIPIIKNLKYEEKVVLRKEYSDSELSDIAKYLLDYIGFDNSRGALGVFSHGYTMKFNNNDVRIAFSNESNIIDHASTIVHEGGHGIFEQNIGKDLAEYDTYDINKYALHESQSRFYENTLGRNKNFWIPIYEKVKEKLGIDISIDEFVSLFNNAKPSLIRTEADELTYCMHIIIRYEIEREIFNGNIDLDELPEIWNQKYKEYLGVEVKEDSEGVLQDMHWSDGSFGYFPSYLLGTILDGMILDTVNSQVGDVDELLRTGRIKEITKFLNENIHKYGGAYNINEVANRVCGRDLDVKPLVRYFKEKYENKDIENIEERQDDR